MDEEGELKVRNWAHYQLLKTNYRKLKIRRGTNISTCRICRDRWNCPVVNASLLFSRGSDQCKNKVLRAGHCCFFHVRKARWSHLQVQRHFGKLNEKWKWLLQKDCITAMKNKRESAMYSTLIVVVSTLTDTRFKNKIMSIVFEVSWQTRTMIRRLEDHKRCGFFLRAWLFFFPCNFSAESCTINVLYGTSNLPCNINQRDLKNSIS